MPNPKLGNVLLSADYMDRKWLNNNEEHLHSPRRMQGKRRTRRGLRKRYKEGQ